MRRWLTIFLLVLLPLQFSWAAAASYCQHEEASESVQHVGHHEHQHEAASQAAQDADGGDHGQFATDNDCGYCHLSSAQSLVGKVAERAVVVVLRVAIDQPMAPESHVPPGLERPDRRFA